MGSLIGAAPVESTRRAREFYFETTWLLSDKSSATSVRSTDRPDVWLIHRPEEAVRAVTRHKSGRSLALTAISIQTMVRMIFKVLLCTSCR